MTITLNDTEIKDIENFCLEMPTKYGLPIIQYLQKLATEQNPVTVEENK
jgi:hypothetical protein